MERERERERVKERERERQRERERLRERGKKSVINGVDREKGRMGEDIWRNRINMQEKE